MKFIFIPAVALSSLLLSSNIMAGTMGKPVENKDWSWFASIAGGPVWARAGSSQTIFLTPDIEKRYEASKSYNDTIASGELFLGIQANLYEQWLIQFGVEGSLNSYTRLQGYIQDDGLPEFTNYSYKYKVQNARVLGKAKVMYDKGYTVLPWVSGAIGAGFNRASGFSNTPLIFEAIPNANFTNHNQSSFAYTVGAGLQKIFNQHLQCGIGYEFADWGKSSLGRAPQQTSKSGISLNHIYTNGFLVNLTYVA